MIRFFVEVIVKSCVPLPRDLELLNKLDIQYTGETRKDFTDEELLVVFKSFDFEVKNSSLLIYI